MITEADLFNSGVSFEMVQAIKEAAKKRTAKVEKAKLILKIL